MKTVQWLAAVGAFTFMLAAVPGARAAGPFTLTCDAVRSGTVTFQLTGFSISATASGVESPDGKNMGRRETKFALAIQTDSAKDYQTLLGLMDGDEYLRSCKLIDGQGGAGINANDSWTQESVGKGKNKGKNNNNGQGQAGSGALEWILTDASVTGVTVNAGPSSAGAPATSIQATIEAQKYTFTQ